MREEGQRTEEKGQEAEEVREGRKSEEEGLEVKGIQEGQRSGGEGQEVEGTQEGQKVVEEDMQKDTGNKNAYIDRAVGLTHCMDMEDMYAEILQDYCSEGIKYQEKLADCMEKGDWKNFTVYVHAVKSSSKTIGAEIFGEEARVLEMAAKEGNISLIKENWEGFLVDFKAVIAAAEKLCAGM